MAVRALKQRLRELELDDAARTSEEELQRTFAKNDKRHHRFNQQSAQAEKSLKRAFVNSTAHRITHMFNAHEREAHAHRALCDKYVPEEPGVESGFQYDWKERVTTAPSLYVSCSDQLYQGVRRNTVIKSQIRQVVTRQSVRELEAERAEAEARSCATNNFAAANELARLREKLNGLERPRTAAAPRRRDKKRKGTSRNARPKTAAAVQRPHAIEGDQNDEHRIQADAIGKKEPNDEGHLDEVVGGDPPPPPPSAQGNPVLSTGTQEEPSSPSGEKGEQETGSSNSNPVQPTLIRLGQKSRDESRPSTAASTRSASRHSAGDAGSSRPSSAVSTSSRRSVPSRPMTAAALRKKLAVLQDPSVPSRDLFPTPEYAAINPNVPLDEKVDSIVEKGDLVGTSYLKTRWAALDRGCEFDVHDRTGPGNEFAFSLLEETEAQLEQALKEAERKLAEYNDKRSGLYLRHRCARVVQQWWRQVQAERQRRNVPEGEMSDSQNTGTGEEGSTEDYTPSDSLRSASQSSCGSPLAIFAQERRH